jgi:hypothetical protein
MIKELLLLLLSLHWATGAIESLRRRLRGACSWCTPVPCREERGSWPTSVFLLLFLLDAVGYKH